ncbi:hypothetical protein G7078_10040 [Sphingomonas sinipercae]|uniref:Uncharacterized protein n=1 Tax=Sphingomonas sinipercae TaxID=2714944 RepID=A0A6G7ZR66_9SPHN|nr:hypothetical protein G7078_10040 [Sphingomonas sinipercae]
MLAAGACVCARPVAAQTTVAYAPVGGGTSKPVGQHPVDPGYTPEDIAKDAKFDLREGRFYNKPGATRAQYNTDWQECRLIARGSRTPAGMVPYVYNPAVISPLAAGAGGFLGGMIASAIIEGQQRSANRKSCLLIRGWRMVKASRGLSQAAIGMTDAQADAYFNSVLGAQHVDGEITERTTFSIDPSLLGDTAGPLSGPEALFAGKKVDPATPIDLLPGEGTIVLATRRSHPTGAGRSVRLTLARYDRSVGDLVYQPRDWKKKGDRTTYTQEMVSGDRRAGLEVQMLKLTAGDYVLNGSEIGGAQVVSSNCFGAPVFHLDPGEVLYIGDFVPVAAARGPDGKKVTGLGYVSRLEDSRRILARAQPTLAAALKPAKLENRATYACSAVNMDRWDIPGAETASAPVPAAGAVVSATPSS